MTAFDNVFQLADVPRPRVGDQAPHRLLFDPVDPLADPRGELVDQKVRQGWDIFLAVAKRGQVEREHAQAVVEVLPKRLLAYHLEQVAVAGRQDADVRLDRAGATDPVELVLLQHAE
jgi:hypothetical protein